MVLGWGTETTALQLRLLIHRTWLDGNAAVAVWVEWDGARPLVALIGSNPGFDRMGRGDGSPGDWIPWCWAGALKLRRCSCGF